MRDGAGMAAGRTCLDCGGSATRDFAFGCEHRFLEPEHVGRSPDPNGSDGALYLTALSLREAEDAIAAAARYDYDEAKRCGEACAAYASAAVATGLEIGHLAAGHGVTAWAPTRETAVALWRARVLEVGRALVELVPWLRSVRGAGALTLGFPSVGDSLCAIARVLERHCDAVAAEALLDSESPGDRSLLPPECRSCGSRLGDESGLCDSCRRSEDVLARGPRGRLVWRTEIEGLASCSEDRVDISFPRNRYELADEHPCQQCGEIGGVALVTGPNEARVLCPPCAGAR